MASTIDIISGASRAIRKGLLELYLLKPNHIVIAENRGPKNAWSQTLAHLPTGTGSRVIILKVDGSSETDALEAVKTLTSQGIEHIDTVIANAGVSYVRPTVSELKIEDLQGYLVPIFLVLNQLPISNAAYGTSKAAVHWLTKRMNAEEENLIAFVVSPGWVKAELGNTDAQYFDMKEAYVDVEDSCQAVVELIGVAEKKASGGKLIDFKDGVLAW